MIIKATIEATDEQTANSLSLTKGRKYRVEGRRQSWGYEQYLVTNEQGIKQWLCTTMWGSSNFVVKA